MIATVPDGAPSTDAYTYVGRATKTTLAALSHAIEEMSAVAGSGSLVIGLFQWGSYFARVRRRFEELAARGVTVVVAYAGSQVTAPGCHRVELAAEDDLVEEWSLVALTPTWAGCVIARDLREFDGAAAELEDGRVFAASWGFDRTLAGAHARRLLGRLGSALPPEVGERAAAIVQASTARAVAPAELAFARGTFRLLRRLEATERQARATRAELATVRDLATRDPLTGLHNREGLRRWLGEGTDGLAMPPTGLVVIDLDGFKQVNDRLGHETGDRLLQAVAEALRAVTRPSDVVVRWGGDEFVVVAPGILDDDLHRLASRLVAAVAAVEVDGVGVTASAGVQRCDRRPLSLDPADRAMYEAKRMGGGRVRAFRATSDVSVR